MRIDILCIGRLKEEYLRAAQQEYLKRLTPYARVFVVELPDDAALERALKNNAYSVALSVNGAAESSVGFAAWLSRMGIDGMPHIAFVIGGADGLSDAVLARCRKHLSLSDMTFPHQLARVILLEQVYRAFRIINNEPYHK